MSKKNGHEIEKVSSEELTSLAQSEASSFAGTAEDVKELLSKGAVLAEQHITLEEGESVKGYFLGFSTLERSADPATGEIRDLPTVRVENVSRNARARLIANYDLKAKLANVKPGALIFVRRGEKSVMPGKGGRSVVHYDVLILEEGSSREGTTKYAALPAA